MKKLFNLVLVAILLSQWGCSEETEPEPLAVISIDPPSGKTNTQVEISGTGFHSDPSKNMVMFNGKQANVLSGTSSTLLVEVPAKAGTGSVTVSVANETATGPVFQYLPSAIVTTFAGSTAGYSDGIGANAKFKAPWELFVDDDQNIYVADRNDHRIRKISPSGAVTTVAGSGTAGHKDGTANNAQFSSPSGLAVDADGNVYVADFTFNYIRKITANGDVSTFAGSGVNSWVDGTGTEAGLNHPISIDIDPEGNLYVVDQTNNAIRKITPTASVTTFSGQQYIDEPRFADGTATTARFNAPSSIARDVNGNFIVADRENNRIRKVTADGAVTTIAGDGEFGYLDGNGTSARFALPGGIGIDPANGNIYVADERNHCIRLITPDGAVSTLAGNGTAGDSDGEGEEARFNYPIDIVVNSDGEIFVSDYFNSKIRKIVIE